MEARALGGAASLCGGGERDIGRCGDGFEGAGVDRRGDAVGVVEGGGRGGGGELVYMCRVQRGADGVVGAVGAGGDGDGVGVLVVIVVVKGAAGCGDGGEIVDAGVDSGELGADGGVRAVGAIVGVAIEAGRSGQAGVGGCLGRGNRFTLGGMAVVEVVASTADWHGVDAGGAVIAVVIVAVVVNVVQPAAGSIARK